VVKYYIGLGWSKTNVVTMIEFYERREIPNKKQEGKVLNGRTDKAGASTGQRTAKISATVKRSPWAIDSVSDPYADLGIGPDGVAIGD
jgi:hypothetical protein